MENKHKNVQKPLKQIFINNFIGGIAWFLGATIGAAFILSVFGFVIGRVDIIPIIGEFIGQVTQSALQSSPQLVQ